MTVCLVWLEHPQDVASVVASPGPWSDVLEAGPGLLLLETDETVSRVYHEVKSILGGRSALLVAPLAERPKASGVTPGTVSWLRERLPLPDSGPTARS